MISFNLILIASVLLQFLTYSHAYFSKNLNYAQRCVPSLKQISLKQTSKMSLYSALHDAAMEGDLDFVIDFLSKEPQLISRYDIDGQIPLHFAAKYGHLDIVKYLVDKGPGFINFKNIRFRTPLHWSCSYAGYEGHEACEEISYFLVENGADININNKDGFPPLYYAKSGPLGQKFANKLKEISKNVPVRPLEIGIDRVYWG